MQIPVLAPYDDPAVMRIIGGCRSFDIVNVEVLEYKMLIYLRIGPASAAAAHMDADQRFGPLAVAVDLDRASFTARAFGRQCPRPYAARLEQNAVTGLKDGGVHFVQRLPRLRLGAAAVAVAAPG
ncbi:hypothetical protein D3C75_807670 [compost metagenome]